MARHLDGLLSALRNRWEIWLWIALLAVVLTVQWPLLKGWVYKATGSPVPSSAIQWRFHLEPALHESRRTGKPVLANFSAAWCAPCVVMKHEVWPDSRVAQVVNDRFVPLSVDVDADGALADRFKVAGIPALLIVDPRDGFCAATTASCPPRASFGSWPIGHSHHERRDRLVAAA